MYIYIYIYIYTENFDDYTSNKNKKNWFISISQDGDDFIFWKVI